MEHFKNEIESMYKKCDNEITVAYLTCQNPTLSTANITDMICVLFNKLRNLISQNNLSNRVFNVIETFILHFLEAITKKIHPTITNECLRDSFIEFEDEVTSPYGDRPIYKNELHILVSALITRAEHWCSRYEGGCTQNLKIALLEYQGKQDGVYKISQYIHDRIPSSSYKECNKIVPSFYGNKARYGSSESEHRELPNILEYANIIPIIDKIMKMLDILKQYHKDMEQLENIILPIMEEATNIISNLDKRRFGTLVSKKYIPEYEYETLPFSHLNMEDYIDIHILMAAFCYRIRNRHHRDHFNSLYTRTQHSNSYNEKPSIVDIIFGITNSL